MDELELEIIDVDNKGVGVAKYNDLVIFVPNTLKGEIVSVRITEKKKKYLIGKVISFIKESPFRISSICPYYGICGGCNFLHTTFDMENKIKEEYVKRIFKNFKVANILFDKDTNYRNKVVFHVKDNKIGLYGASSHDLVNVSYCSMLDDRINKIIPLLENLDLTFVSEILIRCSYTTSDICIKFDGEIDYSLLEGHVASIYINDKLVYGKKYITEVIDNITYSIYPDSFFQVNTLMMQKLYDVIKKYAGSHNRLLDLYCGTGSIGIYLKDNFKEIYGVEAVRSSILNAKLNKKINNINNISFKIADASIALKSKFDVIVVDPPRSGLSKKVISNLLNSGASKIIYTSCDPNTLKRDIELLSSYEVLEIVPVNMFPRTGHIECVCVLNKI